MENTDTVALSERLIATYLAYGFLGKAFFEKPTLELLEQLKQDDLFADWPLDCSNDAMKNGLETLQAFLQEWQAEDFDDVRRDFARLFIGPNRLPAPPWESVYCNEEGLIFDKETLQVRLLYRQFGMAVPTVRNEPDDHFGLEMMFIAHLCQVALEGIRSEQSYYTDLSLAAIDSFFRDHVCTWAYDFLADVAEAANTPYYRGLSLLASGTIAHTMEAWQIESNALASS